MKKSCVYNKRETIRFICSSKSMRRRLLRFAQKPMEDKAYWERIAKKYDGLGLRGLSMALGGLMLYAVQLKELLLQCALCTLC
ncbi:DUF3693 domain-containing protein [Vibrio furnissii]|uniref:DUF3693 domain-containing protein n=1 Tax=Vibrio furnissii TaxID=29494 RepID=UPI00313F02FC